MSTGLSITTSTLQEVGLILLFFIFYLKGCVVVSCPKGDVWLHFELWEAALF